MNPLPLRLTKRLMDVPVTAIQANKAPFQDVGKPPIGPKLLGVQGIYKTGYN